MDRMDARLGNPFKYDRADGCIGNFGLLRVDDVHNDATFLHLGHTTFYFVCPYLSLFQMDPLQ